MGWSVGSFQCNEHLSSPISPDQIDAEGQAAVQQNVVPKHLTPPYGDIVRALVWFASMIGFTGSVGNGYMYCILLRKIIAGIRILTHTTCKWDFRGVLPAQKRKLKQSRMLVLRKPKLQRPIPTQRTTRTTRRHCVTVSSDWVRS